MKKIIMIFSMLLLLCGCGIYNKTVIDTTWSFERAIISLGDTAIEVDISSWTDYEDSDMVQIKTKDGKVYYTHSTNIVLISD